MYTRRKAARRPVQLRMRMQGEEGIQNANWLLLLSL